MTGTGIPRRTLFAFVVALVAGGIYLNALPAPFLLDDQPAVLENPGAQWPADWSAMWLKNYWGSPPNYRSLTIYRPLATLTFALTDMVGAGECAACHRVLNIGLHAGCSVLVFWLTWFLLAPLGRGAFEETDAHRRRRDLGALAAGGLFAVHPVHTEAVVGIVSRCELMSAFFVLLGALALLRLKRGRLAVLGLIYLLALLSKENGATLWSVVIAYHVAGYIGERSGAGTRLDRRDLWLHLVFAGVLAGYMALRSQAVAGLLAGDLSASDNPMVGGGGVARLLTPGRVFFEYLRLLVAPAQLTIDYSLNHVPAATAADWRAWLGVFAAGGMLAGLVAALRRSFGISFVVLAFFGTYVVVSNVLFLSTIIMAERLIYLPSAFFLAGVVMLGARTLALSSPTARRYVAVVVCAVCVVLAGGTLLRNTQWHSAYELHAAAVEVAPDSAKSQHLLANELVARGALTEAVPHFAEGAELDPKNFVLRTNYARVLARLGRFDEALVHLEAALTENGGYRPAFELVCAVFERTGKPPAAGRFCFPASAP